MPHDPHAEFDHTVLEMIEHSPIGAVPRTLTHQDAIKRLLATQQVYASADYKDGFVTARSLGKQPSFCAENLEALIAGQITADALEANARIFDRYVQSLPEAHRARAESKRLMVAGKPAHHRSKHDGAVIHDPTHSLFLVPGAGTHPGLPGNYLYGFVHEMNAGAWTVHMHDSDDGAAKYDAPNQAEAFAKLQEAIASAPFHLSELESLGFAAI
ncbi:MAG: hypothetical protein IPP19_00980 [Verrucomicrobia bacterium]|nr:hypothetical protein [Verrucomicrobiota bacterium]